MVIDFSIFKNTENLIFLFIVFAVFLIVIFIIFFTIVKIIKILKIFLKSLFGKKDKNISQNTEKVAEPIKEVINTPRQKISGGYFTKNMNLAKDGLDSKDKNIVKVERAKEQTDIKESLESLKNPHSSDETEPKISRLLKRQDDQDENDDRKKIEIPRAKKFGTASHSDSTTDNGFKEEKNSNIIGNLDENNKSALEDNDFSNSQKLNKSGNSGNNGTQTQKGPVVNRNIIPPVKRSEDQIKNKEKKQAEQSAKESNLSSISAKSIDSYKINKPEDLEHQPGTKEIPLYEKPDVLNNDLKWMSNATERLREELKRERSGTIPKNFVKEKEKTSFLGDKNAKEKHSIQESYEKQGESFIFGSKSEISRSELRQKLRKDVNIWKAQKQAGLNLSPEERVKLEKEALPQILGRNISKADLKYGLKKLSQKVASAKNISEKTKIKREIKFLKKIGGK